VLVAGVGRVVVHNSERRGETFVTRHRAGITLGAHPATAGIVERLKSTPNH